MKNSISLIGRLAKDPTFKYTSTGKPKSNFTIAVNGNHINEQGQKEVDFINIVAWGKLAENCGNHLKKGSLVSVEAHFKNNNYMKDGKKIYTTDVVADVVNFLGSPSSKQQQGGHQQTDVDSNQFSDDGFPY